MNGNKYNDIVRIPHTRSNLPLSSMLEVRITASNMPTEEVTVGEGQTALMINPMTIMSFD